MALRGEKRWYISGCTSWTGPLYAQPGPPITVRDSQVSIPGPLDGVQIPPSKVRSTTRSRDRGDPGISKGPVLTRVRPYPVRLRSPLRRRPAAAAWLVARDISQQAEPDVRPLKPCGLCIYCGEDAPPVHPANRRCAASAFIVTYPLSWQAASRPSCRRRACPVHCQTVRPCCKVHYVHHHLCVAREATPARQYHADRGCQGARRLL